MRTRILCAAVTAFLSLGAIGSPLGAQAATSVCKDGTTSAASGRGACSGHGGVDAKATDAAAKKAAAARKTEAKAEPKAKSASAPAQASSNRGEDNDPKDAIAQCKDGMYSHSANRRGACSRHGGVGKWLKEP